MPSFAHAHRGIIRKTADHRALTYRSLEWLVKLLTTQLEYCTLRGQTTLVGGCRGLDSHWLDMSHDHVRYPCLPSVWWCDDQQEQWDWSVQEPITRLLVSGNTTSWETKKYVNIKMN